jgi:hypothetical protein
VSLALTLYLALNRLPNLDLYPTLNLCGVRYSIKTACKPDISSLALIHEIAASHNLATV